MRYLVRVMRVSVVTAASIVLVSALVAGYQQPVGSRVAPAYDAIHSNDDIYWKLQDIERKINSIQMDLMLDQPLPDIGGGTDWKLDAVYDAVAGPFNDLDQIHDDVKTVCSEVGGFCY